MGNSTSISVLSSLALLFQQAMRPEVHIALLYSTFNKRSS